MNGEVRGDGDGAGVPAPSRSRPAAFVWFDRAEDGAICVCLTAMAVLPIVEIVARSIFKTGISGSNSIVQHLTLFVGMIGGSIAARESRLLSLATGTLFKGNLRAIATILAHAAAAAIAAFLAVASWQFVATERDAGGVLAYGIPLWMVQLVLPAGFGLIAMRLLWGAAAGWAGRGVAALFVAGIMVTAVRPPASAADLVVLALLLLLLATIFGAPVFATIGGAALILFWGADVPIAAISLEHYRLVVNASLPAIPLFTLAGYFLAEGGASKRLVEVFQSLFGRFRGGPAIVTVLACAFFTSFTGASGVTILALGGLLMPVLLAARYSERAALGLLTSAGSLGLLFPPCLPVILYAIVAQVTLEKMFLGGLLPGILLVGLTAWWGVRQGPPAGPETPPFDAAAARRAVWTAKWELLLPIVALAALLSGLCTPVEAAAATVLYAFVIETFVYRDFEDVGAVARVMVECGLLVGGILLILGVALGFTNYLIDAQIPPRLVEWATGSIHSPIVFLLLLNLFLLVVGCLMDVYSAIVVVVPLIVPLGVAFGIDPVHLGIIFLVNLQLGFLTPPVGMNLFLSSYRFGKPLGEVCRSVIPMLFVLFAGVLLITYVPAMTTALPRLFAR